MSSEKVGDCLSYFLVSIHAVDFFLSADEHIEDNLTLIRDDFLASRNCLLYIRVIGSASVHQESTIDPYRREKTGNGGRGEHG